MLENEIRKDANDSINDAEVERFLFRDSEHEVEKTTKIAKKTKKDKK